MAAVFQCDACKKVSAKKGSIKFEGKDHELCEPCFLRVGDVLKPKPRGRPVSHEAPPAEENA